MAANTYEEGKIAARDIKDTIKDGAAKVGSDVRMTARDARTASEDTVDAARSSAPDIVNGAKAKIEDVRAQTEEFLEDIYEDTIGQIRARPLSSVLIAAVGGAALALLARRLVA
jgi:ElaB/YqjD/DUF883 family membrane-anchored ribosome-binding protein